MVGTSSYLILECCDYMRIVLAVLLSAFTVVQVYQHICETLMKFVFDCSISLLSS